MDVHIVRIPFAQVGSRIQRDDVHQAHQAADSFSVDCAAVIMIFKEVGHLAISPGRLLQMRPVYNSHDVQVLPRLPMGRIKKITPLLSVNAAAIDFHKFALSLNRQFFVFW